MEVISVIKAMQEQINSIKNKYILLSGNHVIDLNYGDYPHEKYYPFRGIITINRSDLVIGGSDSLIEVNFIDFKNNWTLFDINHNAKNIELRNLNIKLNIRSHENCNDYFALIFNNAYGLKIINCKFEIIANEEVHLFGVFNNGNLDTHMETGADNLVIDNSTIHASIHSESNDFQSEVYGIYNNLANCISIQNSFIYATHKGNSDKHKAIGIYTNGRYGRFIGNNIKANGSHPEGLKKEAASAIAFQNEGLFTIISNNNLIGEWAGTAIGIFNASESAIISNNKILATHTIYGIPIRSYGEKVLVLENIVISTSRNARLIEHHASNSIISHNFMEVLIPPEECVSGCGIYAASKNIGANTISENTICNVKNVGIFVGNHNSNILNNQVISKQSIPISDLNNLKLAELLNEKNIKSIE